MVFVVITISALACKFEYNIREENPENSHIEAAQSNVRTDGIKSITLSTTYLPIYHTPSISIPQSAINHRATPINLFSSPLHHAHTRLYPLNSCTRANLASRRGGSHYTCIYINTHTHTHTHVHRRLNYKPAARA